MSVDTSTLHSRRAFLMTGVGSFAALVASALGRPSPVQAGVDGDVVLGASNAVTTTTTSIRNITNNEVVFAASSALGGVGAGGSGVGISGYSVGGIGVSGYSEHGSALSGRTFGGTGVVGDGQRYGTGVIGQSYGRGTGVIGDSGGGIGVHAKSGGGNALQVDGRAVFSRSGRASVAAGRNHVDVSVSGGLDKDASVLAVLQSHRTGVYVAGVRKNFPTSGKARIFLNKVASPSSSTVVAWFVIG